MTWVACRCERCGGILNVDTDKGTGVCPHCNTPYTRENNINNYNTTYVIKNLNANAVNMPNDNSQNNRTRAAETYLKLGEYDAALSVYKELSSNHPYEHRYWLGLVAAYSHNYSFVNIDSEMLSRLKDYHKKAISVAPNREIDANINNRITSYFNSVENVLSNNKNEYENLNNQIAALEKRKEVLNKEFSKKYDALMETSRKKPTSRVRLYPIVVFIGGFLIGMFTNPHNVCQYIVIHLGIIVISIVAGWIVDMANKHDSRSAYKEATNLNESHKEAITVIDEKIKKINQEKERLIL